MLAVIVAVEWTLLILIAFLDIVYLMKLNNVVHHSPFTYALKCLLFWDGICLLLKLAHDVRDWNAHVQILPGDWLFYAMIFVECFPFFFAEFMIPVFSFLFMLAIWKPIFYTHRVGRIKFQLVVVGLISGVDLTMTVYLMLDPEAQYSYHDDDHTWNYKDAKAWNTYKIVNVSLQGVCFLIYCISMLVFFYLLRNLKVQRTSGKSPLFTMKVQLQHASRYFLVCLFFYCGTVHFNLLGHCSTFPCRVSGVLFSSLSRAKWIIFCLLAQRPKIQPVTRIDEATAWK